jgi:hypothetical protein
VNCEPQSGLKISVATKDHIRLRQGFGGQEEHREKPFFDLLVLFRGKKSADRLPSV